MLESADEPRLWNDGGKEVFQSKFCLDVIERAIMISTYQNA